MEVIERIIEADYRRRGTIIGPLSLIIPNHLLERWFVDCVMGFHGDNLVSQRYAPVTVQTFVVIDMNMLAYNVEYCAVTPEAWRRTPHTKIWRTRDGITGFCDVCHSHRNKTLVRSVGYVDVELRKKVDFLPNKDHIIDYVDEAYYTVQQNVCLICITWLHWDDYHDTESDDDDEVVEEEEEAEEVEEVNIYMT